jgi:anti-sigma regulatory factor (Ser/Thr protein kinase)
MTLPLHQSRSVEIADDSGVGEARRLASAWCRLLGFGDTLVGEVALIVTELAANIVGHAREGHILLRRLHESELDGLEILALDRGPGMRNVAQCLVDGYSSRGTSGHGLGSVQRLASLFDIFSMPDRGTAVLAQVWNGTFEAGQPRLTLGSVCLPIAGEEVCGDGYGWAGDATRTTLAILDGLGHGQGAADATQSALEVFYAHAALEPAALLSRMHDAMRATRGAAAAVVQLRADTQQLRFVGVGNCAGSIHDLASERRPQSLTSHNGIVGANMLRVHEFSHTWPADGLLVLHTDGLSARWSFDNYPNLPSRHPSLIAGVLWRDFARQRDDVTVLAFGTRTA